MQAKIDSMVQKAKSYVLETSPTRSRLRPRTVQEIIFSYTQHADEEKLKDKFEAGDKEGPSTLVKQQNMVLQCKRDPHR